MELKECVLLSGKGKLLGEKKRDEGEWEEGGRWRKELNGCRFPIFPFGDGREVALMVVWEQEIWYIDPNHSFCRQPDDPCTQAAHLNSPRCSNGENQSPISFSYSLSFAQTPYQPR